eukprot:403367920
MGACCVKQENAKDMRDAQHDKDSNSGASTSNTQGVAGSSDKYIKKDLQNSTNSQNNARGKGGKQQQQVPANLNVFKYGATYMQSVDKQETRGQENMNKTSEDMGGQSLATTSLIYTQQKYSNDKANHSVDIYNNNSITNANNQQSHRVTSPGNVNLDYSDGAPLSFAPQTDLKHNMRDSVYPMSFGQQQQTMLAFGNASKNNISYKQDASFKSSLHERTDNNNDDSRMNNTTNQTSNSIINASNDNNYQQQSSSQIETIEQQNQL